jgi:dTDP-4-dehydrorhamnose 3,5-epimerase
VVKHIEAPSFMSLDVDELAIPDVKVLHVKKFGDGRGFFAETYNRKLFFEAGIALESVQDNQSYSVLAGTIRALHAQRDPFAQDKLVRVTRGRIWDVAVDIRPKSETFGRWVAAEISAQALNQIFIPAGFLHGFCTLEPDTEVQYKVSSFYSVQYEIGVRWNDPDLKVTWPVADDKAILSDKDRRLPLFKEVFATAAVGKA